MHSLESALDEGTTPWKVQIERLLANGLFRAKADEVVKHRTSVKNARKFFISGITLHLNVTEDKFLIGEVKSREVRQL